MVLETTTQPGAWLAGLWLAVWVWQQPCSHPTSHATFSQAHGEVCGRPGGGCLSPRPRSPVAGQCCGMRSVMRVVTTPAHQRTAAAALARQCACRPRYPGHSPASCNPTRNPRPPHPLPRLLQGLELAVPGTYIAGEPLVTIAAFAPQLHVITSKQRPRKLTIHGSDGAEYMFLLKVRAGHAALCRAVPRFAASCAVHAVPCCAVLRALRAP